MPYDDCWVPPNASVDLRSRSKFSSLYVRLLEDRLPKIPILLHRIDQEFAELVRNYIEIIVF
jgi:hypothetical protein